MYVCEISFCYCFTVFHLNHYFPSTNTEADGWKPILYVRGCVSCTLIILCLKVTFNNFRLICLMVITLKRPCCPLWEYIPCLSVMCHKLAKRCILKCWCHLNETHFKYVGWTASSHPFDSIDFWVLNYCLRPKDSRERVTIEAWANLNTVCINK